MFKRFLQDESGATLVEYAILAALLSIAAVAIIFIVGQQVNQMYEETVQKMSNTGM